MPVRDILNAASSQGAGPSDPYFYDVSLLLNGDGTNGAQNNTFLDSSSNAFTITRNGNTTQGSFSPYGNLWSNYFNGSSSLRGGSSISTGTGDYTVECWANMPSPGSNSNGNIFITIGDEQTGTGCCFYQYNNSVRMYGAVASGAPRMSLSYTFSPNVWYHIAFVRSGITTTAYVNGTSIGTATVSGVGFAFSGNPYVSEILDTGNFYKGDACYISNLRVTQSALYTSNFTPSSTPLTAISGVQFLTCQSNRFIDNSSNNVTLTASGTPSVQRFSPFNPTAPYDTATIGGSGYFNGASYLRCNNNAAFQIGGGDFTMEAWVYLPQNPPLYDGAIASFGTSGQFAGWVFGLTGSGNTPYRRIVLGFNYSNGLWSTGQVPLNAWTHVAVSRSGNTVYMFINGVLDSTQSFTYSANTSSNDYMYVGTAGYDPGSTDRSTTGNISDFRLVKGTCLYTSTFTLPTAPISSVGGTSLLTHMTNAGIPDLAMQNDLETVGSAQVSTAVKKYGTGSLYFDGSNSGLYMPPDQAFAFGTGNYTIEFWVYYASTSASYVFVDMRGASGSGTAPVIYMIGSVFYVGYAGTNVITTTPPSINTWHHIALCRSSGSTKLFIDGTQAGSTYSDSNNVSTAYYTTIGYYGGGGYVVNGYIDDFRVTSGYARYTANFTPPTAALPTY